MGTNETLSFRGGYSLYNQNTQYTESAISVNGSVSLRIKKQVENFADNGVDAIQMFPSMYLFVSDFDGVAAQLLQTSQNTEGMSVALHWYYGFDLSCDDSTQRLLMEQLLKEIDLPEGISPEGSDMFRISCDSVAEERDNFYATYGGLFFLGILLGIVFIFAAVLIIYYKQISEGYEDQARFDIMQKVGLTRREIRKHQFPDSHGVFIALADSRTASGLCFPDDPESPAAVRTHKLYAVGYGYHRFIPGVWTLLCVGVSDYVTVVLFHC